MQVRCSQCGAELPLEQHVSALQCSYCGAGVYAHVATGILHVALRPLLSVDDAVAAAKKHLSLRGAFGEEGALLVRSAWIPYWEIPCRNGAVRWVAAAAAPGEPVGPPIDGARVSWTQVDDPEVTAVEPELPLAAAVSAVVAAGGGPQDDAPVRAALVRVPWVFVECTRDGERIPVAVDRVGGGVVVRDDALREDGGHTAKLVAAAAGIGGVAAVAAMTLPPPGIAAASVVVGWMAYRGLLWWVRKEGM